MKSPIWYFGGKGHMQAKICPLVEAVPHQTYVEPFGGAASILFGRQRAAPVEVYNDLDSDVVEFFRMLRDEKRFEKFYGQVTNMPYSRQEWREARDAWQFLPLGSVERVVAWFVVARQSFGGRFGSGWGFIRTASSRGMALKCSRWLSAIDRLPEIRERLLRVQIENDDFRKIFANYDSPETLFYCDPPYIAETRKAGGYVYEMTADDHRDMVRLLLDIEGQTILSGYAHEIYRPLEDAGWMRKDWRTVCHAAGKTRGTGILGAGAAMEKQKRTESVWLSPVVGQKGLF